MTPEEACECLGISLDDDLTVELLESKYKANNNAEYKVFVNPFRKNIPSYPGKYR